MVITIAQPGVGARVGKLREHEGHLVRLVDCGTGETVSVGELQCVFFDSDDGWLVHIAFSVAECFYAPINQVALPGESRGNAHFQIDEEKAVWK